MIYIVKDRLFVFCNKSYIIDVLKSFNNFLFSVRSIRILQLQGAWFLLQILSTLTETNMMFEVDQKLI